MVAASFECEVGTAEPPSASVSASASSTRANRRRGSAVSQEDWVELKPLVRSLYLDQRYTLSQVAEYLEKHHGFRPT
jgi:hypothetical protein